VEYVLGIVSPITDWVDVELLPPAEYYIDRYLPELYADQKISKYLMFFKTLSEKAIPTLF